MKAKVLANCFLILMSLTGWENTSVAQQIRPHVPLPDEPVRTAIFEECSSCHGIDVYAYHAADKERWQVLLAELHQNTSDWAIDAKNEEILLDYLAEKFGPERNPFPREYVPPEIEDFFDDAAARNFLESTCTECHEIRVYNRRGTAEYWRSLILEMRGNGARLSDENLERLVEWLAKTRGPANA